MTDAHNAIALGQPKTLADILAYLDAVDQGLIDPTPERQAEVAALLVAKIDNTAEVVDELEHQEKRLREAARKLSDGARQVASRIDRIKEYMAFHMQQKGFQKLPGECWLAALTTGLSVKPKTKVPTMADVEKTPQYVRAKWEWDKTALKSGLEALDPAAMEVAELVLSSSASFKANTQGKLLT